MFLWARNLLNKKSIEGNCRTSFFALNLGLLADIKNYFEDWVSETHFKIEYFCPLPDSQKCLE